MKLRVEWSRPLTLKDGSKDNLIYIVDLERLPTSAGVYVFGRNHGGKFEALYIGKASNIRSRVKGQLNNLKLMQHLKHAKTGKRVLMVGKAKTRQGQKEPKVVDLLERALIRYFLSEGHDLVNKQGTRLRRHEVTSEGRLPRNFVPRNMYLERTRGG